MVPHLDWTSNTKIVLMALQEVTDFTLAPTVLASSPSPHLKLARQSLQFYKIYS